MHPGLFNTEKQQVKQISDRSLEWRQYCLDPLFTNYNDVIQNMLKNSLNLHSLSSGPQIPSNISQKTYFQPNPNYPTPLSLSNISNYSSIDQSSPFLRNTPLSPSSLFSLTNKTTTAKSDSDALSSSSAAATKRYSYSVSSSQQAQSSVPSTPTPYSQFQSSDIFQFPPVTSFHGSQHVFMMNNSDGQKSQTSQSNFNIKNDLTNNEETTNGNRMANNDSFDTNSFENVKAELMALSRCDDGINKLNDFTNLKFNESIKLKSRSETNLYEQVPNSLMAAKKSNNKTILTSNQINDTNSNKYKRFKSELRDSSVLTSLNNNVLTMDSSTNTCNGKGSL